MKNMEITNETNETLYETPPWKDRGSAVTERTTEEALAGTEIQVSVQLFGNIVHPSEILDWKIGDMIPLDMPAETPLRVLVQGIPKLEASPGKYKNRIAFRIL